MLILNDISDKLLNEWNSLLPGKMTISELYTIIIKKYHRTIVFFFCESSKKPIAVAKLSELKDDFMAFHNEYIALKTIRNNLNHEISTSIPMPLFEIENGDEYAIVETSLIGTPLFRKRPEIKNPISRQSFRKKLNIVFQWWISFFTPFIRGIPATKESILEKAKGLEKRYTLTFPEDIKKCEEIHKLFNDIEKMDEVHSWLTPVHGDFWKGNLIYGNSNLYVLDWERCAMKGFPIFDLFLLCSTILDGAKGVEEISYLYVEQNWMNKIISKLIRSASSLLNLNNQSAFLLFQLFMFEMATQGFLHYNRKIPSDEVWKQKLNMFINRKDEIFEQTFNF